MTMNDTIINCFTDANITVHFFISQKADYLLTVTDPPAGPLAITCFKQ